MATDYQEEEKTPYGLLETDEVTNQEYQNSLENLRRFSNLDLGRINTVEDLTGAAATIGKDLKIVLLAKGELQETNYEQTDPEDGEKKKVIERRYEIEKPAEKGTISLNLDSGYLYLSMDELVGLKQDIRFMACLTAGDFRPCERGSPQTFAVDLRGGERETYYPFEDTNDPKVQRGFAKILQDYIKELLSILPEPTQLPAAFNY